MGQVCPCGSGGGEVPGMDESEAVPLTNGEASVLEAPKETKAPTANGAVDGDEEEVKKKKKKKKKKDRGRSKTPPPGKAPATAPSDTAQVVKLLSQIESKQDAAGMAGVLKGINDIVKRMPDSDVQAIDGLKAKTLMQRLSSDLKAHPSFEDLVKPEMKSLLTTLYEKHT
mmetsp:Transcript_17421/g.36454  ORF Transcript_17421/g.36454 Transcript_17421/m.36454 type:complete len:170 (-) Transcript_17421:257-766(-)|eukprot:CAMPEP_0182553034 /NCGR_PEP_ID=MMETSP1323-20130603/49278_1 /TAXON_ID=236787 /ORGANISM="Florenciella parvula, Strain RCC1693" /LENGTH=169 /DNA_ID=CAMNT_0024764747 /DNA_START=163 /DNA_END=672 /DNA_ORIENTATION=+